MDTRVDKREHPDWSRHVANARPHAQHGTGVVVRLQSGATLALQNDDDGVEHFVELGQVEDPPPEGKTLIPHTAKVIRLRQTMGIQLDVWVLALPLPGSRVVVHGVSQATRSVNFAQGVDSANEGIGLRVVWDGVLERADHSPAGDGRVDSEEHVVEDDEDVEGARLADGPRLVSVLAVVCIEQRDARCVYGCNGQRNDGFQCTVVDVGRDGERVPEAREGSISNGRGQRRRCGIRRELEDSPTGKFAWVEAGSGARHGG